MRVENAQTKFFHWWSERLGNGSAGYIDKEPTRTEIVDTFLMKYHALKEYREALLAFAETKSDDMLQLWPGWQGGAAPRRAM